MHEHDAERVAELLERVAQRVRTEPPAVVEIDDWARRGDAPSRFSVKIVWNDGGDEASRIAAAAKEATENPGHTVAVDEAWKGFPLEGDEVQR